MTLNSPNLIDFATAVDVLNAGEICAFPTDTVFGIGARADSPTAVKALFDIKQRSTNQPIIVLCSDRAMVATCVEISPLAKKLARYWPGALTLVLPKKSSAPIADEVNGGDEFLGVRIPDADQLRNVIAKINCPLATTSANISGQKTIGSIDGISKDFSSTLPIFVGAQQSEGLESTILKIQRHRVEVLRTGAIPIERIKREVDQSETIEFFQE